MWLWVIKQIPPEDQDRGWRSRYSDKAAVSRNCGSIPDRGKKFILISKASIPAVGSTQSQNWSKTTEKLVAVGINKWFFFCRAHSLVTAFRTLSRLNLRSQYFLSLLNSFYSNSTIPHLLAILYVLHIALDRHGQIMCKRPFSLSPTQAHNWSRSCSILYLPCHSYGWTACNLHYEVFYPSECSAVV